MAKLPAFQFYPGDWLKDPALRRCSKSAKGVWIDMICLSFECEERGVFASSGEPWPDSDIAAAVGGDSTEVLRALEELLSKGVCSRNNSGAIFCRRVVRDEAKRRLCSEAGKRGGGNPDLTFKGGSKGQAKGAYKGAPKPNAKASSSSSISSSSSNTEDLNHKNDSCSEPPKTAPAEPYVMIFPTVGNPKEWGLVQSKLDEYAESFPGIDALIQCRMARQWAIDHPSQRKTCRGMPAFLGRWMANAQNKAMQSGVNHGSANGANKPKDQFERSLDALSRFARSDEGGVLEGDGPPLRLEADGQLY